MDPRVPLAAGDLRGARRGADAARSDLPRERARRSAPTASSPSSTRCRSGCAGRSRRVARARPAARRRRSRHLISRRGRGRARRCDDAARQRPDAPHLNMGYRRRPRLVQEITSLSARSRAHRIVRPKVSRCACSRARGARSRGRRAQPDPDGAHREDQRHDEGHAVHRD